MRSAPAEAPWGPLALPWAIVAPVGMGPSAGPGPGPVEGAPAPTWAIAVATVGPGGGGARGRLGADIHWEEDMEERRQSPNKLNNGVNYRTWFRSSNASI